MLNPFEEFNVLTDTLRDGWSNDYRARQTDEDACNSSVGLLLSATLYATRVTILLDSVQRSIHDRLLIIVRSYSYGPSIERVIANGVDKQHPAYHRL